MSDIDYDLMLVAKHGMTDLVITLIQLGANVNTNCSGALVWAADQEHRDTVKVLLEYGADAEEAIRMMEVYEYGSAGIELLEEFLCPV